MPGAEYEGFVVGEYGKVTVAALAIMPGHGETITFLRQQRGPYAGHWLLPGGKVEFGESVTTTAHREAIEESGCHPGNLTLTGVYEMRGAWSEGSYHLIMFAYLSGALAEVPDGFVGHQVGEIVQAAPADLVPHPTVMRILDDAGVSSYGEDVIEAGLALDGISMVRLAGAGALVS